MKHVYSPSVLRLIPRVLASLALAGCGAETPTGQAPEEPTPGSVALIFITPKDLDLLPGESHQVTADLRDARGRQTNARIEWSSSNTAVATVSPEDGIVSGVGPGTAVITARVETARAIARVTVTAYEAFVLAFTEIDVVVVAGEFIATANLAVYHEAGIHRLTLGTAGHAFATPAWSPDGRHLAVTLIRGVLGESLGEPGLGPRPFEVASDIHVVHIGANSGPRPITTDGWNRYPDWAPEGRYIVYVSGEPGQNHIRIADVDSGGTLQLTRTVGNYRTPRWSPDGERIAFTATVEHQEDVFVMNRDGSNVVNLTTDPSSDASPTWAADGKQIAFSSTRLGGLGDIFVLDVESRQVRRLTEPHANDVSFEQPAWSPDGTQIAFSRVSYGGSGLFAVRPDGTGLRRLTAPVSGFPDYFAAWRRTRTEASGF